MRIDLDNIIPKSFAFWGKIEQQLWITNQK